LITRTDIPERARRAPPQSILPKVSILRVFALSLTLPFLNPIRFLTASLLPVAWLLWTSFGHSSLADIEHVVAQKAVAYNSIVDPRVRGEIAGRMFMRDLFRHWEIALTIWIGGFAALAVWLCPWQRIIALGFPKPIGNWLLRSAARLPEYFIIFTFRVMIVMVGLIAAFMPLGASVLAAQRGSLLHVSGWEWGLAGAGLAVSLFSLWLMARLLPLSALVSSRGLRGSFVKAWEISRGHAFALSLALLGCWVFGILFDIGLVFVCGLLMRLSGPFTDLGFISIVNALVLVAIGSPLLWSSSLGALLAYERDGRANAINPATFD
jgi:hypothetical protein